MTHITTERLRELRDIYASGVVSNPHAADRHADIAAALDELIAAREAAAEVDRAGGDAPHEPCMGLAAWIRAREKMSTDERDRLKAAAAEAERVRDIYKHGCDARDAMLDTAESKLAAQQPAVDEKEIAAWEKSARSDPCLPPLSYGDDAVYPAGYWLAVSEIDDAVALMRSVPAAPPREDSAVARELVEMRNVIELVASQLRSAWEKRDDAPLSAQSHLQEAAFALFHHAPKGDGLLSTEATKLRQSVWKEIHDAHQEPPREDALRELREWVVQRGPIISRTDMRMQIDSLLAKPAAAEDTDAVCEALADVVGWLEVCIAPPRDRDHASAVLAKIHSVIEKARSFLDDEVAVPDALVAYGKEHGLICKECGNGVKLCKCKPAAAEPATRLERPDDASMVQCQFDSVDFPRAVVDALDELDDRLGTLERERGESDAPAAPPVVPAVSERRKPQ